MFQWVRTALKVIGNADGSTFESLLQLVQGLPTELQDLYDRCLTSLLESLEDSDVELIRKLLAWLLLGTRPLTISELMVALAIRPDDVVLPPRNRLHKSIGRFIQRCLSPFIEIVGSQAEVKSSTNPLDVLKDVDATVRPVHNSAQEFLLEVCTSKTGTYSPSILKMDKLKAHEDIARACLIYLRSVELQLGWLGEKKPNKFGLIIADDRVKELLKNRIRENVFLDYASQNWAYHMRQCEDRGTGDIYDLALDFIMNHQDGVWCANQARQFLMQPEREDYWPPNPILLTVVYTDSVILTERYLSRENFDINAVDLTGGNALMLCGAHEPCEDSPDAPERIGRLLIERGVDLSVVDKFGKTALHWTATHGRIPLLQLLLESNADMEIHSLDGSTPMHFSIFSDTTKALQLLLAAGADCEAADENGNTPLHLASIDAPKEMVKLLLQYGARVAATNREHATPLHFASIGGQKDIVELLIKSNPDINARTNEGSTSMHFAADRGFWQIIQVLHGHGASIHDQDNLQETPLLRASKNGHEETVRFLLTLGADPNIPAIDGYTPLITAVANKNLNVVRLLLDHGARVDIHAYKGWTPLQVAAQDNSLEISSLLLAKLNNQNGLNSKRENGSTALHSAALQGSPAMINMLLQAGADLAAISNLKETPLHCAASAGQTEAVKALLKSGADPDAANEEGITPLYAAAEIGNVDILECLLNAGASIDHRCLKLGWTPLQAAADKGQEEAITFLLNAQAFVNNEGLDSETPLHVAAKNGHAKCCARLINSGAKANSAGKGHTPLVLALIRHNLDVIKCLLPAGEEFVDCSRSKSDTSDNELKNSSTKGVSNEDALERVGTLLGNNVSDLIGTGAYLLNFSISDETTLVLQYLLKHKFININQTDEKSMALVHYAAGSESVKAVEIILSENYGLKLEFDNGLPPHSEIDQLDDSNWTPLHHSAAFGNPRSLECFITKGADIKAKTIRGESALHLAVYHCNGPTLDYLLTLDPKFPVDEPKNNGRTALHMAARSAAKDYVEKLLKAGSDLHIIDEMGWQGLHHAVEGGNIDIVRIFLSNGADVNHRDHSGHTPLHLAASHGCEEILCALLKSGATNHSDCSGWTPRDIAAESDQLYSWELANGLLPASAGNTLPEKTYGPTSWSQIDKAKDLQVSEDGCTVQLLGKLTIFSKEQF